MTVSGEQHRARQADESTADDHYPRAHRDPPALPLVLRTRRAYRVLRRGGSVKQFVGAAAAVRRSAADAEETRRAILATARATFAEHGFAASSTSVIAAAAGVTRGALYHHFAGKPELFRAVFVEIEHELNDTVSLPPSPRPAASTRSSPAARRGWTSPFARTISASPSSTPRPSSGQSSGTRSTPGSGSPAWKPGSPRSPATDFSRASRHGRSPCCCSAPSPTPGWPSPAATRRRSGSCSTSSSRSSPGLVEPGPQLVDLGVESGEIPRVVDHPVGLGEPLFAADLLGDPRPGVAPRSARAGGRGDRRRPRPARPPRSPPRSRPRADLEQRGVDDHDVIGAGLGGDASGRSRRGPAGGRCR